jgi:hypothetical protein
MPPSDGSRWEHAEQIVKLVYSANPLASKLARYEHLWTRRWSYEQRLDALEQLIIFDLPVSHLYRPTWLWNLVKYHPVKLVRKLRKLYPEQDALHRHLSLDAVDGKGKTLTDYVTATRSLGAAIGGSFTEDPSEPDEDGEEVVTETVLPLLSRQHAETLQLVADLGSSAEAARILGIKPAAMRQRLKRARDAAKECEAA